jgi:catalase
MMQGFSVHSFVFTNANGKRSFVKFHWNTKLGIHSLVWDESLKIGGQDPDFHRRDVYDAIEVCRLRHLRILVEVFKSLGW